MDILIAEWRYADQLFGPAGSYLHDKDQTMDWLYKARALIGVAILVVVGVHYHHATGSVIANFYPVLGGITKPMILALISVVPATAGVVIFTRRGKRDQAFRQMMRYPVKVALICLIAYECLRVLERLGSMNNALIDAAIIIVGGLIYLIFILFSFRAIYLITVGMCRLGDGHPLLPPVIGTILAWVIAFQSLLTDGAGTGDPAIISLAVLLGGPISITVLSHVEISSLRARYAKEFPFRDGPLPPPDSSARAASARPTTTSARRANRRRYPWSLAIVSTIVPGIVVAAYAWHHSSSPAAVDTRISAIQDGQCIQYKPDPYVTLTSLPVVPCSAMHWGQVLSLISIGDAASTAYPGDDVASQDSGAACLKAFGKAFGSNSRSYSLWYAYPSGDDWNSNHGTDATCIVEASDSTQYEGSLSQQPQPTSPTREKVKPVPLSAVSLAGNNGYSLGGISTAAPFTWPITTASVLPPAPCGAATPSDDWLGSTGARAHYQLTRGKNSYASIDLTVAPLTQAGQESLPDYLKNLPSSCYSPHWSSFQDGMHYTDDSAFTRPDGTRLLLDMGYGKSGPTSYLEYWTVSDGYLLDFVYSPIGVASTSREPMDSALAAAVTHINRVLHTHLRA